MKVIDADSHINSPPDLWQKRVPEKYRDRAPRMVDMALRSRVLLAGRS